MAKKASPKPKVPTRKSSVKESETNISGGVDVDADEVNITGDVVGHDKIEVTNNFSVPRGVQIAIGVMAVALVAIAVVLITRPTNIPNGNFADGLNGWQASGGVRVVATGEPATSPVSQNAAEFQLGGILQMTVTINTALPQLTVWYQWPDSSGARGRLNIYLDNQLKLGVDQIAAQAPGWNVAVVSNLSNYAGKSVNLKLEYAPAVSRSGGDHLSIPKLQRRNVLWVTNIQFVNDADLAKMVVTAAPSPMPEPTHMPFPTVPVPEPTLLSNSLDQFESPRGVAVEGRGNVYVADSSHNRVLKFNGKGTYLAQWGSAGNDGGQFNSPSGIAVDGQGNVFVIDTFNQRIQKFTGQGDYLTEWGGAGSDKGQFSNPANIAIDGQGNVYVTDSNNHVQKFSSNGEYLSQWGGLGSEHGQFIDPKGIVVDVEGRVYVVDSGNNRIQVFSSRGGFLRQWANPLIRSGETNGWSGLAVDSRGNIYVTDVYHNRIQVFNSDGKSIAEWGSLGSGKGQFNGPVDIAVDGLGNVYVADSGNNRVQVFSSNGDYLTQWFGGGQ